MRYAEKEMAELKAQVVACVAASKAIFEAKTGLLVSDITIDIVHHKDFSGAEKFILAGVGVSVKVGGK